MKKRLLTAAATSLLLFATSVQARQYDFLGFTLTWNGPSNWSVGVNRETGGSKPTPNGPMQQFSNSFMLIAPVSVAERPGGSSTASQSFSYTLQAKPGWSFDSLQTSIRTGGNFDEYNGGTTAASTSSQFSQAGGGRVFTNEFPVVKNTYAINGLLRQGSWNSTYGYGANGSLSSPLSGAEGSFNLMMTAGALPGQAARIYDGIGTSFAINTAISAVPISPVPEPETYAMMLAGLAIITLVSKRKASNDR